jgi:hypothetical protein
MINEELKLNCMKFISLNVVSYLEQGPNFEKLLSLPVYLLRDLQNFIKVKNDQKFSQFEMTLLESYYSN